MKKQLFIVITTILFTSFNMTNTAFAEDAISEELSKAEKALVSIAAFTASGNISKLKESLHQGLDDGLTINEIKEALVHIYAYAGFPLSLIGINTFIASPSSSP